MSYFQSIYVENDSEFNGDVLVTGDLKVIGTTTSINSEVVNIADNNLYLNNGNVTTAESGGIVVNYDPVGPGTADTSDTGGFATTTTVNTVGSATFAAGDIIQISSAADDANNGVYEVLTHVGTVLTIDATPATDFAQTVLTVDATDVTAVITQISVGVMQVSAAGVWQIASGATAAAVSGANLATLATEGAATSFPSLAITDETNQLALGTAGVATITAPVTTNTTYTIPEIGGGTDTFVLLDATQTITNKTLTSPIISQITTDGTEEMLIFVDAGTAVNEFTISNAATATNPELSASGGDANIGLDFQAKGTGVYNFLSTSDTAAEMRLYEDTDLGTEYIGFAAPDITASYTMTFPADVGTAGYALTTDGTTGALSWAAVVSSTDFADNVFRISDNVDATKKIAFEATSITTGNVVTLSPPVVTGSDTLVGIDATQILANKTLTLPQINDTSLDHQYVFGVSELTADRTVTLPLLTTNDEFTFNDHTQTLTNKTLTSAIVDTSLVFDEATNDLTLVAADQATGVVTLTIPDMGGVAGDVVTTTTAQILANKTLTLPQINDTSADHQYVFAVSELIADRTVTLPLLTTNDEFTFNDHTQTLTNKTLTAPIIDLIADTNDNELIIFTTTAAATNELTIANAVTGAGPTISTTGGDANVDLNIDTKGTGLINLNGTIAYDNVVERVKVYTGAGAHVLGTDGLRVNIVTHTTIAAVTLPTAPTTGTIYTIVNDGTVATGANDHLVISSGGGDTIDDGATTSINLKTRYRRVTLQYVAATTAWYIV